ncbi:hypothetical protein [Escherichia coli]|uniref:hypothetical protein n=1 Tax=Escherichia coli TaxID=562 RepID=UPI00207B86E0|nr:hypothetical protein [Escherichia coli]
MTQIAIYGFNFTKKITFDGGELTPIFSSWSELKKNGWANDKYILTGFFKPNSNNYALNSSLFLIYKQFLVLLNKKM